MVGLFWRGDILSGGDVVIFVEFGKRGMGGRSL